MKQYYDCEFNILRDVHELKQFDILIISDDEGSKNYYSTAKIIDDILNENSLAKWKDNSKSQFPPDLINDSDHLVMEVMRVDDHSSDGKNNPVLAKQRKIGKEIEEQLGEIPEKTDVFINAVTDLPTNQDHNYRFYYSSFQRTLRKHLSKLSVYRRNYPNYKVIFLILDETSGVYFESVSTQIPNRGVIHLPFYDNRFLDEFIDSDLDYLIWYIPFNLNEHIKLPRAVIFDVKNAQKSKNLRRIDYVESKMFSNEK